MAGMRSLVKDTAIYGLSSMVGKFLNWCLVPFYTYTLKASGEYGVVTELYSWTALVIVIITYGMETGFFRFANKQGQNPLQVYSTTLVSLASSSLLFILFGMLLLKPISVGMGYEAHPEFVGLMIVIVAIDAFTAIPFAYLRFRNKAWRFAGIKLLMIAVNIAFNLFFLVLCPVIYTKNPDFIEWFYRPDYGVGYIFISNLFSSLLAFLLLLPDFIHVKVDFNKALWKQMLRYSLPLLVLGIAGIMNQDFDKIIFKHLFDNQAEAQSQLGIYGACYKVAVIMMMFTQAFRYAYEPYIFAKNRSDDNRKAYIEAMKYYIIFGLFIFLAVVFYMDIIKFLVAEKYREGLVVVPVILICYLFQGIFFNLSLWYKLTDRTMWGAYITLLGCVLTVMGNVLFVPRYGYIAAAWTSFVCYLLMMVISWALGQKYYPIHYDLKSALTYTLIAAALFIIATILPIENKWAAMGVKTVLLLIYLAVVLKKDVPFITKRISSSTTE